MRDFEIFLRRSDKLAFQMGLNIDDLADVLGISRASLYGYRKGQRKVSNKAWAKLESAERRVNVSMASMTLLEENAALAEAAGGTEEERQERFEVADAPRAELVREIVELRQENKELRKRLEAVKELLK